MLSTQKPVLAEFPGFFSAEEAPSKGGFLGSLLRRSGGVEGWVFKRASGLQGFGFWVWVLGFGFWVLGFG